MKQFKKWILPALILLALCLVLGWLWQLFFGFTPAEAESLGVIGGADGPTVIITTKFP